MGDFVVEGLAVAWRSPLPRGNDHNGGRFHGDVTQFCLSWYERWPLLLRHDHNELTTTNKVGMVTELFKVAAGLWCRCRVYGDGDSAAYIRQGVEDGRLFFSTGAYGVVTVYGLHVRWPIVEISLTPCPANVYCVTWPEVSEWREPASGTVDLAGVPTGSLDEHVGAAVAAELARRESFERRMRDLAATLTFDGESSYSVLVRRDVHVSDAALGARLGLTLEQFTAARESGNVAVVSYALSEGVTVEARRILDSERMVANGGSEG